MEFPNPSELIEELKALVTDPAKKLLVAHIVSDTVRVASQALIDPEAAQRELGYIRAATANLAASEASAVQDAIVSWLSAIIRAAIVGS
jgi:hypothetical protein